MRSFIAAFIVATLTSASLTPLIRRVALRFGAVSPSGGRHIHQRSIPRLGGLAVCVGFFAPLIGLFVAESSVAGTFRADLAKVIALFAGGVAMCIVGVVDDVRGIRASHKLLVQFAVAAAAYACGYRIDAISLPIMGNLQMGIFALPITALWIVGIINAVNLIDGLDGLAAGVVFFAGMTNFVVA
jgi:UDP-GlcNAc:undecaprenyl-phosphate/decaprenyl-phosphate GlcNAc-1-phosphate transferase